MRISPAIIADPPHRAGRTLFRIVLAATLALGTLAAVYYALQGLTLSHYDARAHLVVARRILDSLTPGWIQIGAVWLPLPHLLNAVPVQLDWAYRTGATAVLASVVIQAWGLAALARLLARRTASPWGALVAPLVILANPNVLYLQSTPMTEPLLFGFSLLALEAVDAWVEAPGRATRRRAGLWLVALVLTRYEGWFIAATLVTVAGLATIRRGPGMALGLVPWAGGAVLGFLALSKATVGAWFVTSGFYERINPSYQRPLAALAEVGGGALQLAGPVVAAAGLLGLVLRAIAARRGPAALLPAALVAAGALPFIAFVSGHPHRIRYMVPLVVASGALAGYAVAALPRRLQAAAASLVLLAALAARPPLDPEAPMLREAQWETPYREGRQAVTTYLAEHWDGSPILASMGSLAHYMQETSAIGLGIRDYVHEGNGDLWRAARARPAAHVRWILIEERAEGGDQLAALAHESPEWMASFERVAEGGGLALHRRTR